MSIQEFVRIITYFTLFYPIFMSILWIIGGILYSIFNKKIKEEDLENLEETKITVLVPIYNEQHDIKEHLEQNLNLDYNNYEIWAIDDKSTDDSYNIIKSINNPKLKVFQNEENYGKAKTLNIYLKKVTTKYFVVIDSDTILDKDALNYLNYNIIQDEKEKENGDDNKYIAYTGNITVYSKLKNRLYYIQKVEYRSFIDMIKRSQMFITKSILTLSGACSCYNKEAVIDIGGFNELNATEDINISWRFNENGYRLKYIDQMNVQVSTPLNIYDLVTQRRRWTVGLLQTIKQSFKNLFNFKNNFLKLYILEIFASSIWAFTLFFSTGYYIFCIVTKIFENLYLFNFIYGILTVLIFSIILSLIAYYLNDNNREKLSKFFLHYFWFPFAYFLVQPIGFVLGFKDLLFAKEHGRWRKNVKESSRYLFATISDIIITFIIFRIILELIEDSYTIFRGVDVLTLIIAFVVIKALFFLLYYSFLKVGNKFANRKYPVYINISFYLGLINIVANIILLNKIYTGQEPAKTFYSIPTLQLFLYTVLIIVLFNIFKNKLSNVRKIYDYTTY